MINNRVKDNRDRRTVRQEAEQAISSIAFPNIMDRLEIVAIEAARLE